jgi:hypothetical protein
MKKTIVLIFLWLPFSVSAETLRPFLSACGWGVIGGATAGVVSLAFVDKPSESWNNVAKGASLGLYAGIGYGLYQINAPLTKTRVEPSFAWAPRWNQGSISGIDLTAVLYRF